MAGAITPQSDTTQGTVVDVEPGFLPLGPQTPHAHDSGGVKHPPLL